MLICRYNFVLIIKVLIVKSETPNFWYIIISYRPVMGRNCIFLSGPPPEIFTCEVRTFFFTFAFLIISIKKGGDTSKGCNLVNEHFHFRPFYPEKLTFLIICLLAKIVCSTRNF